MNVQALPTVDTLDAGRWNGLLEQSRFPTVFLSWQWQTAWIRAFAADRPLRLLAVDDDAGRLVALLPLYEETPERWAACGGVDVTDYLDLIAIAGLEEEVWDALLEWRRSHPAVWELRGIRPASPTAETLRRLAAARGLALAVTVEERCPILKLPASWEAYLEGLAGKDRHELRRKMRRLERELPGARVVSHASPDGWEAALDRFLRLHRLSKTGKARFMNASMERFFHDATRALAGQRWARQWFLESGAGDPVAGFLCFEHAGTVGLYNSGFDPAHAKLAPGIVLLAQVIRDAIERGFGIFDFLRGQEAYKQAFGPISEDLLAMRVGA